MSSKDTHEEPFDAMSSVRDISVPAYDMQAIQQWQHVSAGSQADLVQLSPQWLGSPQAAAPDCGIKNGRQAIYQPGVALRGPAL